MGALAAEAAVTGREPYGAIELLLLVVVLACWPCWECCGCCEVGGCLGRVLRLR
jgi:hypothetical protein